MSFRISVFEENSVRTSCHPLRWTPFSKYFSCTRKQKPFLQKLRFREVLVWTRSPHYEPATTPYSCHGVFTDRSIFSLNLCWIQIPTGTSMTNCNYKHAVDMFTWGRIVLFSPKRAHVDWNWNISRKKYLKIDWSVKMPLHCLIMRVAGS